MLQFQKTPPLKIAIQTQPFKPGTPNISAQKHLALKTSILQTLAPNWGPLAWAPHNFFPKSQAPKLRLSWLAPLRLIQMKLIPLKLRSPNAVKNHRPIWAPILDPPTWAPNLGNSKLGPQTWAAQTKQN